MSAPASLNSFIYLPGSSIIRCTSNTLSVYFLIAFITGIPNEMLGTNFPSMTSIWMESAPALSMVFISFPRFAKSADNIDGAKYNIFILHSKVQQYANTSFCFLSHQASADSFCICSHLSFLLLMHF